MSITHVRKLEADVGQLSRQLFGAQEREAEDPTRGSRRRAAERGRARAPYAPSRAKAPRARARAHGGAAGRGVRVAAQRRRQALPALQRHRLRATPPKQSSPVEYVPGRFTRRRIKRHKAACRCGGYIVTCWRPPVSGEICREPADRVAVCVAFAAGYDDGKREGPGRHLSPRSGWTRRVRPT